MNTAQKWRGAIFAALLIVFFVFCIHFTDAEYYAQLALGELDVLTHRVKISALLEDERIPEELKRKLRSVVEMREFAIRELGLPSSDSYTAYVDIGRKFAIFSLVATPEFSERPETWCLSFAGCFSSLTFFDKVSAQEYAKKLSLKKYDVSIRGATSYSTAGIFADPAMNTLFELPADEYVGIIFHEMAHEKLRMKNDAAFNEAFAIFVAQAGQYLWIRKHYGAAGAEAFLERRQKSSEFSLLVTETRRELKKLYSGDLAPEEMRVLKRDIFAKMREKYAALKKRWGGYAGYDRWMEKPLNNARIAGEDEYGNLVPAFQKLFDLSGGNFFRFYENAAMLARLSPMQREREMQNLSTPES